MKTTIELSKETIETMLTALENDARRLLHSAQDFRSRSLHKQEYAMRDKWVTRIDAIREIEKQLDFIALVD